MPQPQKLEPGFGLDTSVFMQVIENGDTEQRVQLATQLAGFPEQGGCASG